MSYTGARERRVGGTWEPLDLTSDEGRRRSLALLKTCVPQVGTGARFYNVEWMLGPNPDWGRIRAYVLRDQDAILGFAAFLRQERPLAFHFGEMQLASARLTRFTMRGEPYLAAAASEEVKASAATALFDAVIPALERDEALYFEGLPIEGGTYRALSDAVSSGDSVVLIQIGAAFPHQFIEFPASFKEYLDRLGSRSRQSVQYSARRLERDMPGHVIMRKFADSEQVTQFLADASALSRKTYQANLLGLGLHDDPDTRARLSLAAERGWLRSYILYCRDIPAAFMLGFEYGGCYYYDDVGYDPDYAKWSVGTVLQLKVIEEIYSSPDHPTFFDFSTGFGQHKGRFGNMSRPEANLLLMRRSWRSQSLAALYRSSEGLSAGVVNTLDGLGIKERVKKLVRRLKRE